MGASERRKGQAGEREARKFLVDRLGDMVSKRDLSQSRDGGADLRLRMFRGHDSVVEVKRRNAITLHAWLDQAEAAADGGDAFVMARGDGRDWFVAMSAETFCTLIRELHSARAIELQSIADALANVKPEGNA